MSDTEIVTELQRLARSTRSTHKRRLLLEAAERIWHDAADDEPTPMPCPKCGSRSTDCDC